MLKYRGANSSFEDFESGLRFKKVIEEQSKDLVADDKIAKVILCSGQIYYDLEAERTKRGINNIAIVRVENLAPFPFRDLEPSLKRYKNAKVTWAQEEPKNQGPWTFADVRIRNLLKKLGRTNPEVEYVGRNISPSTATGYGKQHAAELQAYLDAAMTI